MKTRKIIGFKTIRLHINSILLKISITNHLPYLKIKCYDNTQHFLPKSFPLWNTQILDPWKLDCKCVIFSTQLTKSSGELSGCMWDGLQLCEFRNNREQLSSKESFWQSFCNNHRNNSKLIRWLFLTMSWCSLVKSGLKQPNFWCWISKKPPEAARDMLFKPMESPHHPGKYSS